MQQKAGKEVNPLGTFTQGAKSLSRSPLGIIALFIVLVYGFASLVTTLGSSLGPQERLPLVYFLVIFPVLVLAVFAWLVSCHWRKLYGPGDYRDENNFVRMTTMATASLAAAASSRLGEGNPAAQPDVARIADTVRSAFPSGERMNEPWRRSVLWVDDQPQNNVYEGRAFESVGVSITQAESTTTALELLRRSQFAAIISDMGRREGQREGYALLEAVRSQGNDTPFFIYAGSNSPEHRQEAARRGAQGSTNDPEELFRMVMNAVAQTK
jgi:CheY-like chemotaxis protein